MTITIKVNNLALIHRDSGGVSTATLPDVCKTPPGPVPVPYPNVSFSKDLAKGTKTVLADGGNMCANCGSEFAVSVGDEPGVAGGVVSGVNMHESTWITYSFNVRMEGRNACRLTDKKFQNHMNTVDMGGTQNPDPVISAHKCTVRKGQWIDGPHFIDSVDISGPGVEFIGDYVYEVWEYHVTLQFKGTVECKCPECGATTTMSWTSPTLDKVIVIYDPMTLKDYLGMIINRPFKAIFGATKAAIAARKGIKAIPAIYKGVKVARKVLKASPDLICAGQLKWEQIEKVLEAAISAGRPRVLPPGTV